MRCKICGQPLRPRPIINGRVRGRLPYYCSPSCKSIAWHLRHPSTDIIELRKVVALAEELADTRTARLREALENWPAEAQKGKKLLRIPDEEHQED